ncbi:3-oxoacyl-[acyl-carrier-protein] synthase 2 [Pirellula sp. SH-Sr6A]|uniref:beta-ketoacyl-[acyl-carrier-protein] synthase family protein n=1 Tax=Pirellula sp. SH-Sr6A TaxID=1632865 RepID=UPI00078B7DBC|nr:beta-ketoacyl-[acyl-carrier-protein] synthase family protein [Pirellula sp. SH-Sr6A]AMV33249.1 3-oxoacyl-[acyl-carrier-protein] synthase 2 [Pirellula sp. SH-Sr6A]
MRRRVVVTGIGMINPLGHDVTTVWSALKESQSGVGKISLFDPTGYPTTIAAEVKAWDVSRCGEDPQVWSHRGRHTRFAIGAAHQAIRQSGILDSGLDPTRLGVYMGAGEGNQDFHNFTTMMAAAVQNGPFDLAAFLRKGREVLDTKAELEQEPNMPAAHLAALFNAQGPNSNCLTACAASSQAVGEATELIRSGDADAMIAGGAHSMIHPFGLTGFSLLTTLSQRNDAPEKASRPFDKERDGFVLGEGAAIVILEEYEHARKRGAEIFGEILGYGSTADAYRITDIHPEGRGAIGCMRQAIADAKLNIEEIGYVNAHGTSTSVNDRTETLACKGVFGDYAKKIPVSSTKSMMGHLIAAAGVTEMIVCLMAIRDGILPPTINQETPDPDCDLDYVPNVARPAKIQVALNNSFGFGGQNVTLAVGKLRS